MGFERRPTIFDSEGKVYVGLVAAGALLACLSFFVPVAISAGMFYMGMIVGVLGAALLIGKYFDMKEKVWDDFF